MNILYISHLSNNIAAGLNWSVPAGVEAQSQVDNVFWLDLTLGAYQEHWGAVNAYHNIALFADKFSPAVIDRLPPPFNKPDVVVFEGFYYMDDVLLGKRYRRMNIPYIIIPRGSFTYQALHNHAWLKKCLAHALFFDKFIKNAVAIQYLTRKEADDSCRRFKNNYFIVPNGFNTPSAVKTSFSSNCVRCVFIGRLDIYHKGLDVLIDAIELAKDSLRLSNFSLAIYGPRRYDFYKLEKLVRDKDISDIVSINDEISGQMKEDVLLSSDVFILTSRLEGHPMGLIEALAHGVPALVTPGSNMSDEIIDSKCGWVCPELKKKELAITLETICKEKKNLGRMSQNARELASRYNWDILSKQFHNELQKLIR